MGCRDLRGGLYPPNCFLPSSRPLGLNNDGYLCLPSPLYCSQEVPALVVRESQGKESHAWDHRS
jgi:hypothetical protein